MEGVQILINSTHRPYFASLDGIRGLAFLIVLASHLSQVDNGDRFFSGIGKIGVWIFFILSSFLLTYYFYSIPAKARSVPEWLNFAIRRFLRIFPMYLVVLLFDRTIRFTINTNRDFALHLLLREGFGHYWTIPAEFTFYGVLPIVVLFFVVVLKSNLKWAMTSFIVFLIVHQLIFPESQSVPNNPSLIPYLPVFVTGALAALIQVKLERRKLSKTIRLVFDLISALILIAFLLTDPKIWSVVVHPVHFDAFQRDFIYFGIASSILIICILNGTGYVRHIFETRFFRFTGRISFSAYLIHPIIIVYTTKFIGSFNTLTVLMSIILIYFISTITYFLIERPLSHVYLKNIKNIMFHFKKHEVSM